MANAFEHAFENSFKQVVLMGTDFPDLPGKNISEALVRLKSNDAVIGPTVDGGYYLIGFSSDTYLPKIFNDIPWGTTAVFQKTMNIFFSSDIGVHQLPEWRDVGVYDDLKDLIHCLKRHPDKAINTYSYLEHIGMIK